MGIEAEIGADDFYGQSYFVDPRGQFVGAVGSPHDEELIVRDMDFDVIEEVRQTWQFYRDRRPEMYGDLVSPSLSAGPNGTVGNPAASAMIPRGSAAKEEGSRAARFSGSPLEDVMQFGFTLKPDHTIERTIALTKQAEAAGFDYGWLFDIHVLWRDPYPLLTLMAQATTTMRLGTCVTNPATREPTSRRRRWPCSTSSSGGRMDLGIGRGDSARRVLGKPPTSMKDLEQAVHVIRALVEGAAHRVRGHRCWSCPGRVGGTAARVDRGLRAGGAQADRADRGRRDAPDRRPGPDPLVRRPGARSAAEAGRDPSTVQVMAAAPAHVGDLADGRDRTRWFPALVRNHVVDLVNKYPREDLPEALTAYIRDREGYDYLHHAEVGSSNASFVDRRDRRPVLPRRRAGAAHRAAAHAGRGGVDQFNLYLMNGNEEEQVELYGKHVIPALRDVAPARA